MKLTLRSLAVPFAVANLIFLCLHQMDAVYWQEWQMVGFRLTYSTFLLLTILLCLPGIYFIWQLTKAERSGFIYAFIWSLFGFIVPIFHTYFFLNGDARFKTPLSIFLIYMVGLLSIPLFIISISGLKKGNEKI